MFVRFSPRNETFEGLKFREMACLGIAAKKAKMNTEEYSGLRVKNCINKVKFFIVGLK
jgi:hypothetical protein